MQVRSPGQEDPLEAGMATSLQSSCLENRTEQRSLAGHSSWGLKALDTNEASEPTCASPT